MQMSAPVKLAVIGDPVEHSFSPRMHNAALAALGIDGSYEAIRATTEEFLATIRRLLASGYCGANITIPHKAEAARLAHVDDKAVFETGVANALKFDKMVLARNTDIAGFLHPIQHLKPAKALLLGAGGASISAAYALDWAGWDVNIWNRTKGRAVPPRAKMIDDPDPIGCTLVVNATPLGLHEGEMPPLLWEHLSGTVYDLPYRDGPTDFLQKAASLGNPTIDGREMLVEQGALSLEWWLGVEAPRDVMRKAVGL